MRWKGRRGSENVEDRRNISPRMVGIGGGGAGLLLLLLLIICLGGDPLALIQVAQQNPQIVQPAPEAGPPVNDEMGEFVSVVLADTEDVWRELFRQQGYEYRDPQLVLYRGSVPSACGFNSAATGPFYCPADAKVYIDLSFFDEMRERFRAPGDFAQAYVIAHEVGHHVQNMLGISDKVSQLQAQAGKVEANDLSVRLELQADFFAGVWAHHAQQNWQVLEEGDIEEALAAAEAIGDDRLQRQMQGYVVPESFTHGSSEQRQRWFIRGLRSGDMSQGDTFSVSSSEL